MSDPTKPVSCATHGSSHAAFVCHHLPHGVGLGFFHGDDEPEDPRPDAWCARCDEVMQAEGEWNDDGEDFADVTLVCAGCYDELRARNRYVPSAEDGTFACAACGGTHDGLPYDFGSRAPDTIDVDRARLTADTCIDEDDRYVRACLEIPIVGGPGPLVYGVWVTLSHENFREFAERRDAPKRYQDGPYFGWFASRLPGWPETIHLKARVHLRPPPLRPVIELQPTDHPLAVAQREGISIEDHRRIALALMH